MNRIRKSKLSPKTLSALSQITDNGKRRAFLRRRELLSADVVLGLNEATQRELRVNTTSALSLAQAAVLVARHLRKTALLAQCHRIEANVLAARGEYQSAVELYKTALGLFQKVEDSEGIARTLTAAIQPHIMLGSYEEAFEAASNAQRLFRELGDHRRLARLENNIGNIYHRQDRFDEALTHYERAYRTLLSYGDSEELTISLNNMSMCLISLNDFELALATYARANELLQGKELPLIRLINNYNIAYLHYLRGDYSRAIEMLKSACLDGEKIGYDYLVALCYLDLSDIYVELNLSNEAQETAEKGNLLFQKLGINYEAGKTLANQAIVLGEEGQARRALELFKRAKPLFLKEDNAVWPWLIDLYQAVVLFNEGKYVEAKALAAGAAAFFDSSYLKNKAALSHFFLAQLAIALGETDQAHRECSQALGLLEQLDAPILRFTGHLLFGQIEQSRGNLQTAYAEYQRARAEMESLRSNLTRHELKISFMKNRTELYENLVSLCLDNSFPGASQREAFHYVELAKSRSLTELMLQGPERFPQPRSGRVELESKTRALRRELSWYQHRIELEQLRPGANSAQKIENLTKEAQQRESSLLRAFADSGSAERRSGEQPTYAHIPVEGIQELLGNEATLLEYFFARDTVLAAVLTKDALTIHPVSSVSRVSPMLSLVRFQMGKVQLDPEGAASASVYEPTIAHLGELYDELIRPIRELLNSRHLVIVPHGILHYLSFSALHDGEKFLLDSYAVSYAPSSNLFALCHLPQERSGTGTLILGVPDVRAPLIRDEVEVLNKIIPEAELYQGDSANHDLFLRKAPLSRLIHIATHGIFRPDNPMFSGIRLSDGYLHLYELFQMKLSADLFTLSGCATGLNVVAGGDELLGLVRGLLYAGARSLLLSLWDINDGSTRELMAGFYRSLIGTGNPVESLTQAARDLRERYPHPYFWAPFVLVGKALSRQLSFSSTRIGDRPFFGELATLITGEQ
jgi:CHAT domain-containing protein/tetratricopeptide (TPR) repeat protein